MLLADAIFDNDEWALPVAPGQSAIKMVRVLPSATSSLDGPLRLAGRCP